MTQSINTPWGIVDFPDDMTSTQIERALGEYHLAQIGSTDSYNADPLQGKSGLYKFAAGMGRGMTEIGRGIGQRLGVVDQSAIDQARAMDAPLMETGAGKAGNIAGGVVATLPAMLVPGANTLAGAALIGAGTGALAPTATGESVAGNMAAGAAGGLLGQGVAKGMSRALNPQTSANVKQLIDEGITPTPGQIMGGAARKAESAAESIPILGTGIKNAKIRANEQFNLAALNRALKPIGASAKDVGHEGLKQARDAVEKAYDDALNLLPRVDFDAQFIGAMNNIHQMGNQLIPDRQRQLEKILTEQLYDKLTPASTVSGSTFKTMESQIKKKAREMMKSADFDQRQMGDALNAVAHELKLLAGRTSPQAADALKAADQSYARLLRVEQAAQMQGAPDGVFTPSQFGNAVRSMDGSVRRKGVAQGEGLMQDLATAGRDVLGDRLPNSGTADRLMNAILFGGGAYVDPVTTAITGAGLGAGRAMYTDPMQDIIANLLTQRPDSVRAVGDLVRLGAPVSGLTGIQGLLNE